VKPQSRRSFLRSGTLAALAAGCVLSAPSLVFGQDAKQTTPAADIQIPFEATQNPIFYYTQATFEPYVGSIFRGRGAGRTVNLELIRVERHLPSRKAALLSRKGARATRSFSLTFRADGPLSEITTVHKLEHAALGRFDLFLTQRGEGERGQLIYEAVFNHLD
jgi:hypothetical protein